MPYAQQTEINRAPGGPTDVQLRRRARNRSGVRGGMGSALRLPPELEAISRAGAPTDMQRAGAPPQAGRTITGLSGRPVTPVPKITGTPDAAPPAQSDLQTPMSGLPPTSNNLVWRDEPGPGGVNHFPAHADGAGGSATTLPGLDGIRDKLMGIQAKRPASPLLPQTLPGGMNDRLKSIMEVLRSRGASLPQLTAPPGASWQGDPTMADTGGGQWIGGNGLPVDFAGNPLFGGGAPDFKLATGSPLNRQGNGSPFVGSRINYR